MSIWWRRQEPAREQRSHSFGPVPQLVYPSSSYAEVDLTAAESSMQVVAVRAAVDLIASLSSELPIDVFQGQGTAREKLPTPPWLADPGGDGQGLEDWSYQVLMSWLLRGNLYGDILNAQPLHLTQVTLHHPDHVTGWIEEGRPVWMVGGKRVENLSRFLHRRVNPMPGTVLGLSPISLHASTIGLSLSATRFGRQWFADGAHPGGMLTNSEETLNKEKADTAKARFMAALRGVREPVVMGKGWKFEQIQIAPEESQFLETNGFSSAECARMFGPGIAEVLGYAAKGGSLTYANVVDRDLHVLKYALNKWLRRLERLLSSFLPPAQHVKINRDALLETSTLQRYQAHASALTTKWKVPNEVRAKEDLPPVPWGDVPITDASEPEIEPESDAPVELDPDDDDADVARNLTEMVQKVYLGVGKVVTAPEARALLNRAGAGLPEDFTPSQPAEAAPGGDEEEDE